MSWTGSENQRREQGNCAPPALPPSKTPRFTIPAGISCEIKRVEETVWRPFVTRMERGFERYESYERALKAYVFRDEGFQLRIKARHVKHRESHRL